MPTEAVKDISGKESGVMELQTESAKGSIIEVCHQKVKPHVAEDAADQPILIEEANLMSLAKAKVDLLGGKVPIKNNEELVKPASDESVSGSKIKQVEGGLRDVTPDSPNGMKPEPSGQIDFAAHGRQSTSIHTVPDETSVHSVGIEEPGAGEEELDNKVYRCMFHMRHFRMDDVGIQIQNQTVLIDAKHERQVDEHGFVSRSFVRRHELPVNVMADKLTSSFSGDGILVLEAPYSKI